MLHYIYILSESFLPDFLFTVAFLIISVMRWLQNEDSGKDRSQTVVPSGFKSVC